MTAIRILSDNEYPPQLREIANPPRKLYLRGTLPSWQSTFLCVVGSRRATAYGLDACKYLVTSLARRDVVIVSGLALGIDTCAHRSALSAGITTLAVPGSGLDNSILYPRNNCSLAESIVQKGGALLSEFTPHFKATTYSFPQRNRIMAGLSQATLIIEASERSGSLITARLALEYNRDVCVLPGSIFSPQSFGANRLIKQGAIPITSSADLLEALGFEPEEKNAKLPAECSIEERLVLDFLNEPKEANDVIRALNFPASYVNILLSGMEIKGLIVKEEGKIRALL